MVPAPSLTACPNFSQVEESEAKCAEAQRSQQTAALQLESLHAELDTLSRNKTLVRCVGQPGQGSGVGGGQRRSPTSSCMRAIASFFSGSAIISVFRESLSAFTTSRSLLGSSSPWVAEWVGPGAELGSKRAQHPECPLWSSLYLSGCKRGVGGWRQRVPRVAVVWGVPWVPHGMCEPARPPGCFHRWTSSCTSCSTSAPTC